ncbi:MAG: NUDIX hydrolase [Aeriscardovia sp.]|nr:NUDIX hydrolase [Aeriscardovia sp.]MBR3359617.1 NUDIX hydrolase [Aeriscardovia sp.]
MGKTSCAPHYINAGGAIVFRWKNGTPSSQDPVKDIEICIVHRQRYDDWSFPKGKQESHESIAHTAVREVGEETGYQIRLGAQICTLSYPLHTDGLSKHLKKKKKLSQHTSHPVIKRVVYWIGHLLDDRHVMRRMEAFGTPIVRDTETDQVVWMNCDQAAQTLTYDNDHDVLNRFCDLVRHGALTGTTLLLASAEKVVKSRKWSGDEVLRPLTKKGVIHSYYMARNLASYGADVLHITPAARYRETLALYSVMTKLPLQADLVSTPSSSNLKAKRPLDEALRQLLGEKALVAPVVWCADDDFIAEFLTFLCANTQKDILLPADMRFLPGGVLVVTLTVSSGVVGLCEAHWISKSPQEESITV